LIFGIFLVFLFSYGFYLVQDIRIKRIPVWTIVIFAAVMEFTFFAHNYFQHVSMYTAIPRSDGNFQAAQYIQQNKHKYDSVYMMATGWFPVYYLYTTENFNRSLMGKIRLGLRMDDLENITFIDRDCMTDTFTLDSLTGKKANKKSLIIFNSGCETPKDKRLKVIGNIKAANSLPIYILMEMN